MPSLELPPTLVAADGRPVELAEYPATFAVPDIEVVGPRLLILPAVNVDRTTKSGLFIPAHAQEQHSKGIVLKKGDGIMLDNGKSVFSKVKVGQEIIYARYAGVELRLEFDGREVLYLIIQESDVRAVLSYRGNLLDRWAAPPPHEKVSPGHVAT